MIQFDWDMMILYLIQDNGRGSRKRVPSCQTGRVSTSVATFLRPETAHQCERGVLRNFLIITLRFIVWIKNVTRIWIVVICVEVPLCPTRLNPGDVFILDLGSKLYQWNGPGSSKDERFKVWIYWTTTDLSIEIWLNVTNQIGCQTIIIRIYPSPDLTRSV